MRLALSMLSLCLCGLSVSTGTVVADGPSSSRSQSEESIWSRVQVVGASASAGFRTKREAGRRLDLAKVLEVAIRSKGGQISSQATSMFFLQPLLAGDAGVRKATESRPTLVFAIDFLFWFGYGVKQNENERMAHLERGFRYLERFSCPILISKIPDMRDAVGKMLFARQVPKPETLASLNRRIEEWARSRKNVIVVPLVDFFDKAKRGETIQLGITRFPANSIRRVLQRDELHPTVTGLSAIAVLSLEALAEHHADVSKDDFERDVLKVARRVLPSAPATK